MNQNNIDYLKNRLLNMGFGDKFNSEMEKNITNQVEKFQVPASIEFARGVKKDTVDFKMDFSKSKESDMYFVNKFEATLRGVEPSKDRTHIFYIDKANSFTAKESFNMLEGRAVHKNMNDKDGNPYQQWIQLDLSQKDDKGKYATNTYHTNYGFDLEKALGQHPLKELTDLVHKERLISSLERGNLQSVTFIKDDQETKMFIEANPKMKNLNVYNDKMEKQFQGVKKTTDESVANKTEQKENALKKNDLKEDPKEGMKKPRGMSV